MNQPTGQPSLATLLYPPAGSGRPEDVDGHELMEYFQHDYSQDGGDGNGSDPVIVHQASNDTPTVLPLPGNSAAGTPARSSQSQRKPQVVHHVTYPVEGTADPSAAAARRNATQTDLALPIPPSLSKLASQVIPGLDLPNLTASELAVAQEQALVFADYGERGEMGGKRRKAPHERAGWREMDQQTPGKRRRTRKTDTISSVPAGGPNTTAVPVSASAALTGALDPTLAYDSGEPPAQGSDMKSMAELSRLAVQEIMDAQSERERSTLAGVDEEKDKEEDTSKMSRAEQNKRAQQAFRRRREEHMKKLQLDSAQLESVKRQLADKDATLRELLQSFEASKVEIAALQAAIKSLIPFSTASVLSPDGQLVVDSTQKRSETRPSSEQLEHAYGILYRQANELARQNKSRQG